jgi:hypothetical protein
VHPFNYAIWQRDDLRREVEVQTQTYYPFFYKILRFMGFTVQLGDVEPFGHDALRASMLGKGTR